LKIDWTEKPNGIAMLELRDFMKRSISKTEGNISTLESILHHEWHRGVRIQDWWDNAG
jgi:hypothetical protein